jgi:hypothetical protein
VVPNNVVERAAFSTWLRSRCELQIFRIAFTENLYPPARRVRRRDLRLCGRAWALRERNVRADAPERHPDRDP